MNHKGIPITHSETVVDSYPSGDVWSPIVGLGTGQGGREVVGRGYAKRSLRATTVGSPLCSNLSLIRQGLFVN